ncbi:hypothetical protein [Streptomyces sp. t39]|uniref:hypothetical protein n=1 Tax=Streptomyces sp. t39 TaxID=1828156 RepID=UPI00164F46E3|nr:hypothetical protein [Streptomyces sp. t39]
MAGEPPHHGVRINPPKAYARQWDDADEVIVVAATLPAPAPPASRLPAADQDSA